MKKYRAEYVIEKCFWGDQYRVIVFEEHKNMPGFAPEVYDVKICEIWMKYYDWERRIEFENNRVDHKSTLKFIMDTFTGKLDKKKYKRITNNE